MQQLIQINKASLISVQQCQFIMYKDLAVLFQLKTKILFKLSKYTFDSHLRKKKRDRHVLMRLMINKRCLLLPNKCTFVQHWQPSKSHLSLKGVTWNNLILLAQNSSLQITSNISFWCLRAHKTTSLGKGSVTCDLSKELSQKGGKKYQQSAKTLQGIWGKKQNRYSPVLSVLVLQAERINSASKSYGRSHSSLPAGILQQELLPPWNTFLTADFSYWQDCEKCWTAEDGEDKLLLCHAQNRVFVHLMYTRISFRIRCYFCHSVSTENKRYD